MKLFVVVILIIVCNFNSQGQKIETIKITGAEYPEFINKYEYKFPAYTRAKIALKNGDIAYARINYNNFFNTLKYIDGKGDTMEIANAEEIAYINAGLDTLFYENGYYEWVASSGLARLVVRRAYKEGPRALVGAFGTASPAQNVVTAPRVSIDGLASHKLNPNEQIAIIKETTFYINNLNNPKIGFVLATKKNIDKLFPKLKVQDFIDENKLNLNKEEDLIDVMVYISNKKN